MKFYLISDNIDTQMGMRLAGISGAVVHEPDEVREELEKAVRNKEIAIILMTEKLVKLIVEIPDRHATSHITDTINRYVSDAIGLKL